MAGSLDAPSFSLDSFNDSKSNQLSTFAGTVYSVIFMLIPLGGIIKLTGLWPAKTHSRSVGYLVGKRLGSFSQLMIVIWQYMQDLSSIIRGERGKMDHTRNLLISAPVALALLIFFFFAFSSQGTIQIQNAPQPMPATVRGFPLPFQYVYNCQYPLQIGYCSTATPTTNPTSLSNPSSIDFANAALDYAIWLVVSLAVVSLVDAVTSKRFKRLEEEEEKRSTTARDFTPAEVE